MGFTSEVRRAEGGNLVMYNSRSTYLKWMSSRSVGRVGIGDIVGEECLRMLENVSILHEYTWHSFHPKTCQATALFQTHPQPPRQTRQTPLTKRYGLLFILCAELTVIDNLIIPFL